MSSLLKTSNENILTNQNPLVKDVFVINVYKGNSSNNYKVNTNLNMTDGQYMVKIKNNNSKSDHLVYDTIRGINNELCTNKTFSEVINTYGLISFNNDSYSIGSSDKVNSLNNYYTSITFKKFPKFFDIIEYIGDGVSNRSINHNLNCNIGLISIKAEDIYSNWLVRHKDAIGELIGEQPYEQQESFTQITELTNTYFKVSNNANLTGVNYIAYIYAHNSLSSGFIQCGTYTGGYQEVVDTVVGTGVLKIPDDVKEITLICKGGTGGNNFWNDPGQPFVQGVPEQKYIPPIYAWSFTDDFSMTTAPVTSLELWDSFAHERPLQPVYAPTGVANDGDTNTYVHVEWWIGTMDNPVFKKGHYSSYLVDAGQPFIAAIPDQLFKAATSGGSIYSGGYSKIIAKDITHVFEGGSGGPAMPETLVIQLNETDNRYIDYNIANGGSLIYKYKTGGITNVVLDYTLSPTVFTTNLVNRGSIEIPKGVTKVTINCNGGIGSNDTYLVKPQAYVPPTVASPGQEYIAPFYTNPGRPYIAPSYSNPGQSYIAPSGYNPGQPYIAPVYSSPGKAAVAAVYLNPGQAYVGPTPYDPGQPYIASVTGQPYIAAVAPVPAVGNPSYPAGLPPYVATVPSVPGTTGTPAITIPAGWRYTDWTNFSKVFWDSIFVTSEIVANEATDFKVVYEAGTDRMSFIYAFQAPGSNYYYLDLLTMKDSTEVAGQVPTDTQRGWSRRWENEAGNSISWMSINHTWHAAETIPAVPSVPGVPGVPGQGLAAYPNGLPPYSPAIAGVTGQPYIASVAGQPYIAPTYSSPGKPYIAPTIGVGDLMGPSSSLSINSSTFTYPGSLGWADPVVTRNILSLKGDSSQSLTYNIPPTGKLNISYEIPNYDKNINDSFKPYYLLIKSITKPGDWIEIDCRRPDFNLKQNKSDSIDNTNLLTINDNGFSPNHILINEMNQKYVYMVIRK